MRARLAIVITVGTLGLAVATDASADSTPPILGSPDDQVSFMAPGDGIVFQASPPVGATPTYMDFYIARDPTPDPTTGVFANFIDHIHGSAPGYAASPSADVNWPSRPDTYYWQAVYYGCIQPPVDCFNESATRSFTITPRPASSVSVTNPPDTFLTDHPRRRIHQRKARFAFSSDVTGASFQCFYAKGWAACKSPHIFRHLEPGRFRFQTRAGVNGIEDPTPASWTFKVRH
jgi:hypothetical protein